MNNLIVNGIKNIDGMKFHDIEGGFGEGKKAMLVKEIANIHNKDLRVINQNIERNRERFKDNIDIVDLKGTDFAITLSDSGIYTQNSINASKNIYLLSERGYSKLLKILEDDFAWEQYDKLVDGYFNMRNKLSSGQAPKEISAIDLFEAQVQAFKEVRGEVIELKNEIVDTRNDFEEFKEDLPLIGAEPEELQATVRSVGTRALGGYECPAYNDTKLRSRVYQSVWKYVKEQFNVRKYRAIKRKHLSKAKEIAESYTAPFYLQEEINMINNQSKLNI
ncbi:ORF6C domain-containing protein [Clostridium perfringens]